MPETAVLRLVYRGQIRRALPHWLIEETPDQAVLATVPGVYGKVPEDYGKADYFDQLFEGWSLVDDAWKRNRVLRLTPLGAAYSVDHYWRDEGGEFLGYQINFQEPLRRTPLGFDTFDQELDIVVTPDGSWRWKDVDSFERGVRKGVISEDDGKAVRELACAVALRISDLTPTGWETWKPNPEWLLPELLDGWDALTQEP